MDLQPLGPYQPAPWKPGQPATFSQTWTFGDIIYSMIPIKLISAQSGPSEFYLRLENLDNLCRTVIGWPDGGGHKGRMTQKDFDLLKPLIEIQPYISKWAPYNGETITHPLDNICCWFYGNVMDHGHYGRIYAKAVGLEPDQWEPAITEPWLFNVKPASLGTKKIVISKTDRYGNGQIHPVWQRIKAEGINDQAYFVGTQEEHADFEADFDLKIQHYPTRDLLELAEVIAGSDLYIGNQSVGMAIAQGLGVNFWCDHRKDNCTLDGCETYFKRDNGYYF